MTKNIDIGYSQNFMKTHFVQQIIHQLQYNINRHVNFEIVGNRMGPLNDENKLQIDEKTTKMIMLKKDYSL